MSVAKRKWGESLSGRREELQKAQLLLQGICVSGRDGRGTRYLPGSEVFDQGFRLSKVFSETQRSREHKTRPAPLLVSA
jgi:hypothetical protein